MVLYDITFFNMFLLYFILCFQMVELRESIASIEIITCYLNDIRFLKFPSF